MKSLNKKIEIPDFISERADNFYKEVGLDRQKATRLAVAKAKRDSKRAHRSKQVGA
jgi:hypothetical protein